MVHSILPQMNTSFNEQNCNPRMNDIHQMKRNLTLDLQQNKRRSKFDTPVLESQVISSPDFHKFNLRSPDVTRMLLENGGMSATLQTPTPTTIMRTLFPKQIYEDEIMVDSYGDTLSDLPADSNMPTNNYYDSSYPTSISTSFGLNPDNIRIKEEPQTVPSVGSSPPVSPINMDTQEQIKKDRKKARNREAAAKCRKKKLEKIARLEGDVRRLSEENKELSCVARRLKDEVANLQVKIMRHHSRGCAIILPS